MPLTDFESQSPTLHTKKQPIAMLCLGADVEFAFTPRIGCYAHPGGNVSTPKSRATCPVPIMIDGDEDDEMGGEELGTGLFGQAQSVSVARKRPKTSTREARGKNDSATLLTMGHGDMVLLFGDDFDVSSVGPVCFIWNVDQPFFLWQCFMKRTGMGIRGSIRLQTLSLLIFCSFSGHCNVYPSTKPELTVNMRLAIIYLVIILLPELLSIACWPVLSYEVTPLELKAFVPRFRGRREDGE